MAANVMVVVERQFDYPRPQVFRAWTAPAELARWRGIPWLARGEGDRRSPSCGSAVVTTTSRCATTTRAPG